ncbi:sodium/glutamate symporter [Paraburkholderia caballeronis]|uniref:Sodium/glutamate symporter n=1 Tax=Paraburkholderia caballeronis TaxID=416943 RepID=A0A1H7QLN2_9BURK|nr:sodium/glutamate symporter [Paraburkholderia caballeronis]PXW22476.1 ESS family glutamate:Na+ symporter [Paraburkholderia caballeronis]PXW96347.1 ESS family glutamate:Na+ symporter [Paraburkholderia caballeronis]RAJ92758.1 ESS family glutamate:Na+ symporter [Paraburkholderia caballeronis]SEE02808.1 glutamate:Na+ symporter, ESS family [Paraburkholderia caballeronis]SEL49000.1 glutamate:Na+ symporter, ESS family [Paraburkholderia caballeronis]
MTVSVYATLVAASLVLLLGNRLLAWIPQLRAWTIPEPVAGGLVVALVLLALHAFAHFDVRFDTALQTPLMFTFFATIGLNAKLASLKQGGPVLVRFLAVVVGLLILQNVVGVGLALAFGIDPLYGLLGGSVSLAGGHGTGAAWGAVFTEHHGLQSATEAAIACATFGLVMGGILGGPVAQRLMKRLGSASAPADTETHAPDAYAFEEPRTEQATTPAAFIDTVMLIAFSLWVGELISDAIAGSAFELPTFVCVLFVAVLVSNGLAWAGKPVAAHAVALIANVSLALFLAMALMTLRLWDLAALALPVATILLAQTVMMVVYAFYVTFRAMGSDYDAVVLTAGHCGFGLGATPTAIANMQAVTARFGHSHLAFLIVPMVAAFFIDIANAIVIQLFLRLPVFH